MLFKSIVSILAIASAASASPILTTRDSDIQCSSEQTYGTISLGTQNSNTQWPITLGTETNGQTAVELGATTSAIQLPIIKQQCNSTALGLTYSEQYTPGTNPVKFFFQYDISKCLQRLPNSNNQIVIGDCSKTDNVDQQYQFWDDDEKYQMIQPITYNDGKVSDLQISLSSQTSGNVLASSSGDFYLTM